MTEQEQNFCKEQDILMYELLQTLEKAQNQINTILSMPLGVDKNLIKVRDDVEHYRKLNNDWLEMNS